MIFNSAEFLIFYPIVLLGYFLFPKKCKWPWLLAVSYFFYMIWNPPLIFLILFTTAVSYVSAILIERSTNRAKRIFWLTATLVTSLGVLFFFKYFNFLAGSVTSVLNLMDGGDRELVLNLILPVGISFYTFQTLSYVIDVYRGHTKAETHFGWYALFVSFFPQLVAGPIERPDNLLPQLKADHKLEASNAWIGLQKMAVGFFKKIVVADLIAAYVNAVYNNAEEATGWGIVIASVLFSVQIYCDFSGYTDIAIGCARIMGIRLMQNFDRPYQARSIKEFWARWHISLSTWFRDYLYIPLGGNRCSKARHYFNLFVVFLVSGLWHGANWTFVLWGTLHGVYQIVGALTKKWRMRLYTALHINTESRGFAIGQRIGTFILVCFSWILFRANSIADVGILLTKLFSPWGSLAVTLESLGFTLVTTLVTVLSIVLLSMIDRIGADAAIAETGTRSRQYTAGIIALVVCVAWCLLLSVGGASAFIYFQF
ncbi:MAG: MBOAT family protein [Clostridia bacterium]|nr:MBOAT family protein [Clostridia bacterium]